MENYTEPFYPDSFYTVYNSGNNREKIFYSNRNFEYFLDNYYEYLFGFVETYSYSLVPDQFQILVKTPHKTDEISNQFRKFFISYAKSINRQQNRRGSLFLKPFKKKLLADKHKLLKEFYYIHSNPVSKKICSNYEIYKWSSFKSILSNTFTKIPRKDVLELFEDRKGFIQFHKNMFDYNIEDIKIFENNENNVQVNSIKKY